MSHRQLLMSVGGSASRDRVISGRRTVGTVAQLSRCCRPVPPPVSGARVPHSCSDMRCMQRGRHHPGRSDDRAHRLRASTARLFTLGRACGSVARLGGARRIGWPSASEASGRTTGIRMVRSGKQLPCRALLALGVTPRPNHVASARRAGSERVSRSQEDRR